MNKKSKNVLTLTVLAAVCVGLFSFVLTRTNADAKPKAASSGTSSEIIMATPNSIAVPDIDSEDADSAFVPSSGAAASAPLTTVSKPTSTPSKPTPPASSALTNPSSKPAYSSKPTSKDTSQPSGSAVTKKSSSKVTRKPSASTPTTGNKTSGYDPIFGDKRGTGHAQQTTVNGDWGGGSQVGIMD